MFATLSDRVATRLRAYRAVGVEAVRYNRSELQYARLKIQVLEEHLRLRRIAKYGPGSEKLSNLQLELLEEEPGSRARKFGRRANARRCRQPDDEKKRSGARIPAGRRCPPIFPAWRRSSPARRSSACAASCGAETEVIGYEVSEVLDVKPAEYFVEVTKREKRACKTV